MSLQLRIQSLLDQLTASGVERGVQFTAYRDGQLLVDAASGVTDLESRQPVTPDTLFPVFSVSKGITATLIHQLVERGSLDYDTPIAAVWPEFAAHGKERITLRQALNHSAGLPHMPSGIGFPEMCDWAYMCRAIAALTPSWKPGSRIDEPGAGNPAPATGPESIPSWMGPLYAITNRADLRHACLPASSGIMNARSIARHYAALLPGGVDGVELLPPHRVKTATEPQPPAQPEGEYPLDWGLGYKLGTASAVMGNRANVFGHAGFGGANGFADPESRLSVGFTKNLFANQDSLLQLMAVLR